MVKASHVTQRILEALNWYSSKWKSDVMSSFVNSKTKVLPSGESATFNIDSGIELLRVNTLMGEEQILSQFLSELRAGDVVYDIGANIGLFTCFAATTIPDGTIIGFEPHPVNADRLRENLSMNGGSNYQIMEYALSNVDSKGYLHVSESQLGAGRSSVSVEGDVCIQQCKAESLIDDDLIPPPTVVKIDVEGAELRVLEGFGSHLDDIRTLFCEVHPKEMRSFGDTPEELEALLESRGLTITDTTQRGNEYHIIADKATTP